MVAAVITFPLVEFRTVPLQRGIRHKAGYYPETLPVAASVMPACAGLASTAASSRVGLSGASFSSPQGGCYLRQYRITASAPGRATPIAGMVWDDKSRAWDARHLLRDTACCWQTVMATSFACASFQGVGVRHLLNRK